METIRVINHNSETIKGRFDGEDFIFPKDESVDIPFLAAKHIFGLGEADKSQVLNMLGWLVPGRDTYDDALKKLDCISFLKGKTVFPEETDEDAGAPAIGHDEGGEAEEAAPPVAARARGKTGGRPHVAGAGGESEAGSVSRPASANPT